MIFRAVAILLFVLIGVCPSIGQTSSQDSPEDSPVKITFAKNDTDGNIIENPDELFTGDIPVFCYIDLKDPRSILIKIDVFMTKVIGVRPNSKFVTLKYQTKKDDGGASFTIKPKTVWATGEYRVDVYLGSKLVGKKSFTISKKK